jgi:predicted GNAT family acetyltransferase
MDTRVVDHAEEHRFELWGDGELIGFLDYRLHGEEITLVHTEIDPAHGGAGHGSTLVRGVLDQVRARGLSVRPMCPYAKAWIEKHPDYADLVVATT